MCVFTAAAIGRPTLSSLPCSTCVYVLTSSNRSAKVVNMNKASLDLVCTRYVYVFRNTHGVCTAAIGRPTLGPCVEQSFDFPSMVLHFDLLKPLLRGIIISFYLNLASVVHFKLLKTLLWVSITSV